MDANKFAPLRLSPIDRLRGRLTLSAQADTWPSLSSAISIAPNCCGRLNPVGAGRHLAQPPRRDFNRSHPPRTVHPCRRRPTPGIASQARFQSLPSGLIGQTRKDNSMRRNKLRLYLHLVWATWDRHPLITPEIERPLYRCIQKEAKNKGCTVLALNGVADHVHLLVSFPTTITIAELVKQVKGVSSYFVNQSLKPTTEFKWQGFYGAFTVSRWDVDKVFH